jgi:hypothetical protein
VATDNTSPEATDNTSPAATAPPPVATNTAPPVATDTASPVAASSGGAVLRSMTEAHKHRDKLMNGADMCCLPVGPYETEDSVIKAVLAWAWWSLRNSTEKRVDVCFLEYVRVCLF